MTVAFCGKYCAKTPRLVSCATPTLAGVVASLASSFVANPYASAPNGDPIWAASGICTTLCALVFAPGSVLEAQLCQSGMNFEPSTLPESIAIGGTCP